MIISFFDKLRKQLRSWAYAHAESKYAIWWLSFIGIIESSVFIFPVDILLISMLMTGARRWVYYAFVVTVSSVIGGILGYVIGAFFFEVIGSFIIVTYGLADEMAIVSNLYEQNNFWAVFISAFTPLPYKVFTISAGFFNISFITFVVASFLGRLLRFFAVAYFFKSYGPQLGRLMYKYFIVSTFVVGIVFLVIIFYIYI